MTWPNGYDRRKEWGVALLAAALFLLLGFIIGRATSYSPNLVEIWQELDACQAETRESCSLVVMPDSSRREVMWLYSQHVK